MRAAGLVALLLCTVAVRPAGADERLAQASAVRQGVRALEELAEPARGARGATAPSARAAQGGSERPGGSERAAPRVAPRLMERDEGLEVRLRVEATASAQAKLHAVQGTLTSRGLAAADREYDAALATAHAPLERTRLQLGWADTLAELARRDPRLLERAAEAYRAALPGLEGTERAAAYNNYGRVLLRRDLPDAALDAFAQAQEEARAAGPVAEARLLYNAGRARERIGEARAAVRDFRRAAERDPHYEPAARAVFRVLLQARAPEPWRIRETVSWARGLVARGDTQLAASGLQQALARPGWRAAPGIDSILVDAVLALLVAAPPAPAAFARAWSPGLEAVAASAAFPAGEVAREIGFAFTGDLPVRFEGQEVQTILGERFPALEGVATRQRVAALLRAAGDAWSTTADPVPALARYAAAWSIDNANVEAGLAAAGILLDETPRLEASQAWLDQFIQALFEAKGEAYLGRDWPAILRFHTVLGEVYARLGTWGPRGDPRSALFQWEHALRAHRHIEGAGKPVPVLRANLGRALAETGHPREALGHYLDAAEDALALGDPAMAAGYVEAASSVAGPELPDAPRRRMERIRRRL